MSDPSEPSSRISCGAKRDLDDRSVEGADRVRKTRRHDEGVQDSKEPREHKKSSKKHKHERKEKKEKVCGYNRSNSLIFSQSHFVSRRTRSRRRKKKRS